MEKTVISTPAQVKEAVAQYFKEHHITMADAGLKMNMSRASVSYALSMVDKYFTRSQAVKYAHYFNMNFDYLTKGEGELLVPGSEGNAVEKKNSAGVFEGVEVPKEVMERILLHEERRYRYAQHNLSMIETILKSLDESIKLKNEELMAVVKEHTSDPDYDEQLLLIRRSIRDLEKAKDYTLGKSRVYRRIIGDIEEDRERREHPELWEKTDDKRGETTVVSSRAKLLNSYLRLEDVAVLEWDEDGEQ